MQGTAWPCGMAPLHLLPALGLMAGTSSQPTTSARGRGAGVEDKGASCCASLALTDVNLLLLAVRAGAGGAGDLGGCGGMPCGVGSVRARAAAALLRVRVHGAHGVLRRPPPGVLGCGAAWHADAHERLGACVRVHSPAASGGPGTRSLTLLPCHWPQVQRGWAGRGAAADMRLPADARAHGCGTRPTWPACCRATAFALAFIIDAILLLLLLLNLSAGRASRPQRHSALTRHSAFFNGLCHHGSATAALPPLGCAPGEPGACTLALHDPRCETHVAPHPAAHTPQGLATSASQCVATRWPGA